MNKDFSVAGLEARLLELLAAGFRFSTDFSDSGSNGFVFLRHDIDLSLARALTLAKLESKLGVQSTFFILVSSDFYNVSSRDSKDTINEIKDSGHQIGLHFDISAGPESQVRERLKSEIEILESITKSPIRFFSQHKPATYGFMPLQHGSAVDVKQQIESEGSCVSYCSDSSGFWSHGDYAERGLSPESDSLQLLLHPIWWAAETSMHPLDTLFEYLESSRQLVTSALARNINRFRTALEADDVKSAWPENIR